MFVIIITYTKPIEEIDLLRPQHLEYLDKYYKKDIFIASGRQKSAEGGIILANAESEMDIELILVEDPFYTEKAATYKIIEFTPSKVHTNIGKLITI